MTYLYYFVGKVRKLTYLLIEHLTTATVVAQRLHTYIHFVVFSI